MFNYETILSSFDKRGTLMKQLQDMENAFNEAGLSDVEVVDETATSLKLKFTFADGSDLTTSAIDIKGAKGDTGNPATVAVGTVSTLPAGSSATVTNSGTTSNAVFNFGIPKGDTGDAGGVTTFGGQNGAITIGNGLQMSGKQVSSYDFNLTTTGSINVATLTLPTNVTSAWGTLYYALNTDKSIGKIYGYINVTLDTVASSTWTPIDTGLIVAKPNASYSITVGTLARKADGTAGFGIFLQVDSAGHLYIGFNQAISQSGLYWIEYPACLYFFKDFGDTPLAKGVKPFAERMAELSNDEVR